MEHASVGTRLSHISRPLFIGVLLMASLMVYLAENFAGVEAEVVAETAVTIDRATTKIRIDRETAKTVPYPQDIQVDASQPTVLITQTNPAYGINRISNSEQSSVPEAQYQNGLATGATWDRWPMYWSKIEFPIPGEFHWDYQDTSVKGVIEHGLKLNVILLGTPGFYHTPDQVDRAIEPTPEIPSYSPMSLDELQSGVPLGLETAVFADGTDIPGVGKAINAENKWAVFVGTAVNRYKPGGIFAQQEGWAAGVGVTHWEMWNEPDLTHFWDGSEEDYARLLKVGYLAAKHADSEAQVIFGGLAEVYDLYKIPYYNAILEIYDGDAMAQSYNYFHDVIALHNYSYAYRSWRAVYLAQIQLDNRTLANEVWLNETGVPVWDDYPGPVCNPNSAYRATMQEQADFVIQNALYARFVDVDNIFFFSLHDECGNAPDYFNPPYFPPDQCTSDPPGFDYAGDAFGLFRNWTDAHCSTHHPSPGTARPAFNAFQVLTQYFVDVEPLWRARPGGLTYPQEWFAFFKPSTGERVMGLWTLNEQEQTAVFNSTHSGQTGLLITPDGITQTITATNGVFTLTLPGATNNNTPTGTPYNAIGGRPFLLIEQDDIAPDVTISAPPLAAWRAAVSWQGNDLGSNIANYDVTVSENGEPATPWLIETTAVSANYGPLQQDSTYIFTVYGRDQAGNLSAGVSTSVFAPILDEHVFLPTIQNGG